MKKFNCRYCFGETDKPVARCAACGSWLSWLPYLVYPEAVVVLFSLTVSVIAAWCSYQSSRDARSERIQSEVIRKDIITVADATTKMTAVLADGSGRWGGIPSNYRDELKKYQDELKPYLTNNFEVEMDATIQRLRSE